MGSEDKRMQINVKHADMREILGDKNMQEINYRQETPGSTREATLRYVLFKRSRLRCWRPR